MLKQVLVTTGAAAVVGVVTYFVGFTSGASSRIEISNQLAVSPNVRAGEIVRWVGQNGSAFSINFLPNENPCDPKTARLTATPDNPVAQCTILPDKNEPGNPQPYHYNVVPAGPGNPAPLLTTPSGGVTPLIYVRCTHCP
jgi:hypothetical protein